MINWLFNNHDNIIPEKDIAKSSLMVVVAIMTFLCSCGFGAIDLLQQSVSQWNDKIYGEATIEVMPIEDRDIEQDLHQANAIARSTEGIFDSEILSKTATEKLISPWLGDDFDFHDLALPRIILLHIDNKSSFDPEALNLKLKQQLPNANFKNEHNWVNEVHHMANKCIIMVLAIVFMLLFSLIITIIFATKSAVSTNQHIIDVLYFIGANKRYIAKQFRAVFFKKALTGAFIGVFSAITLFLILYKFNDYSDNYHVGLSVLFGDFKLTGRCYLELFALVIFVTLITINTSRLTVMNQLNKLDLSL